MNSSKFLIRFSSRLKLYLIGFLERCLLWIFFLIVFQAQSEITKQLSENGKTWHKHGFYEIILSYFVVTLKVMVLKTLNFHHLLLILQQKCDDIFKIKFKNI